MICISSAQTVACILVNKQAVAGALLEIQPVTGAVNDLKTAAGVHCFNAVLGVLLVP